MGTTTTPAMTAAPVADDPLGPVLAPEDDLVALADSRVASRAANARAPRVTSCTCAAAPDSRRHRRESRRDAVSRSRKRSTRVSRAHSGSAPRRVHTRIMIQPIGHEPPAGLCRRRALRHLSPAGAEPVLRARDARDRRRAVALVRWPAGDRCDGRSLRAGRALVWQSLRAARAAAAAVHAARSALCARDWQRARVALPRHPESRS